jgi:hypothetical protein
MCGLTVLVMGVFWLVIISVPALGEVLELLPRLIVTCWVVHTEKGLLRG